MNRFKQSKKPSLLPNSFPLLARNKQGKPFIGFLEQLDNYTSLAFILLRVTASALVPVFLHRLATTSPMMTTTTNYMDRLYKAIVLPITPTRQENPLPLIPIIRNDSCYSFLLFQKEEAKPAYEWRPLKRN